MVGELTARGVLGRHLLASLRIQVMSSSTSRPLLRDELGEGSW